jgi:GTP-binding protein
MIVATKSDKLNKNELFKSEKVMKETLKLPADYKILHYSSLKRVGTSELLDNIFEGVL